MLVDATVGAPVDRCTTLPELAGSFPLTSPVPSCATSIKSVTLVGFSHTWAGDVQVVLTNPAGVGYNLIARLAAPAAGCLAFGHSSDFVTNYTLVAAADPYITSAWPVASAATIPGGLFPQYFGEWVSGSAGVANTDLASIPAVPGIWTLNIYDGAAGDSGSLVSWCIDGTTTGGEFLTGVGGIIPAIGTGGGGSLPTTLPTAPSIFPLSVAVGNCGSVIRAINLSGLSHTWAGDVQVVLESPSLARYTLIHRLGQATPTAGGYATDFIGNTYNILDPSDPGATSIWPAPPVVITSPASIPDGNYPQYFGTWVNGILGINNTPLGQIPVESGIWTLYVYDWAMGDVGSLGGWAMVTGRAATAHVCDGNANTTGVPAIFSTTGSVSLAQNFVGSPTQLTLNVEQLPLNVFGYFVMGNACNRIVIQNPLSQGVVCVGGTTVRGLGNQIVSSGLTGSVSIAAQLYDMPGTNGLPTGMPAIAGQRIYTQFWFRDNNMGMPGSNLSNALFFIVRL